MAIQNKIERKIEQSEVQAVQTQSTAAAESTRQTQAKKPVNMLSDKKVDPETLKNNEIINYMNSDKFKNLSEEEQLKYFKEHYCTGLTDEQTSAMFTNAKKLAAEAAQISSVSDGAKTNNAAAKETALTADARKQAEQAVIKELQTVQKTENPSRKDVYEYLLKKETDGTEMTDAEKAVLKTYKSLAEIGHPDFNNAQSASAGAAPSAAAQQTSNELVPMKEVLSSNFLEKSPQEQVTEYMKAYLEKNDPDYAKLSKKEQTKKCNEEVAKLVNNLGILQGSLSKTSLTKDDGLIAVSAMALLTDLNTNGEKLSDIPTSRAAINTKIDQAMSKQIKNSINTLLNNKDFQSKTNREQFIEAGNLLLQSDRKYQSLSDDAKVKYIFTALQKKFPQLEIFSTLNQDATIDIGMSILKYFAQTGEDVTLQSVMSNPAEFIKEVSFSKKINLSSEERDKLRSATDVLSEVEKKYGKFRPEYVVEYLKSKGDNITDAEKKMLDIVEKMVKRKKITTKEQFTGINNAENHIARWNKVNSGKSILNSKEVQKTLDDFIDRLQKNPNDTALQEEAAAYIGCIRAQLKGNDLEEFSAMIGQRLSNCWNNNATFDRFMNIVTLYAADVHENDEAFNKTATETNYKDVYLEAGQITRSWTQERKDGFGIASLKSKWKESYTKDILNGIYTQKEAKTTFTNIVNSGKVSKDIIESTSKSLISTASPERQKYYVTEFGKLKNAAVTNGLAAACNSVDNSVKAYYKQALVKAIESGNYTAEQKAGFAKAMKTGTVSSSAEPRTADKAQVSDKAPASAKADTASAAQTAQTSELQAKVNAAQADLAKETAASAIRDTASSYGLTGSTQASKTSSASSTASAASLSSASSAQSAKEASEAQKEKAMANAASTKEDIDKSVKKWEEEHNTTLTENEIKSLQTAVCAKVVEELLNDPETANSTAEVIHKLVANSTSVTDLYTKLVDIYGTKVKDKFIEILAAKGSSSQVSSFAQNATNSEDIKNLYLKCDNAVLKTELLNMLPPTSVSEMLRKGQIEDLTTIDYKILSAYITDNIGTMSNTEFNKYLQYLPLDERQKLCQLRLKSNPSSAEDSTISGDFAQTVKSDKATAITAQNSASHEEGDAASPFRSGPAQTETDESARLASNGYAYGSDNWLSSIQAKQSGIKVPPSDSYDTEAISFEEDFWDIGSSGSTKVSFNERYDKQKHTGAVYWG